jgi:hypothetical protein
MSYQETIQNDRTMAGEVTPVAYQCFHIITGCEADENVRIECETNDDNDDGWPDGEVTTWVMHFPNVTQALKYAGTCRVGISGVIVTVTLDGREVR